MGAATLPSLSPRLYIGRANRMGRILIVDDREEVRAALAMMLEDRGYEIIEATDGNQVLPMVLEYRPDLVLLDLAMPAKDGFQALREVKANEQAAGVPIIVITARTDLADQAKALSMGVADYVTKPFSVAAVVARISEVLKRNGRSGTSPERQS
jgi:DNA-binding response OmpR family regulator